MYDLFSLQCGDEIESQGHTTFLRTPKSTRRGSSCCFVYCSLGIRLVTLTGGKRRDEFFIPTDNLHPSPQLPCSSSQGLPRVSTDANPSFPWEFLNRDKGYGRAVSNVSLSSLKMRNFAERPTHRQPYVSLTSLRCVVIEEFDDIVSLLIVSQPHRRFTSETIL